MREIAMTALQSFYDLFDTLNQIRQREFNHADFVMLSNHLSHNNQLFQTVKEDSFTSAQKRELLSQVVAKFKLEYNDLKKAFENSGLDLEEGSMADEDAVHPLWGNNINFGTCPPEELDEHINTLQSMIEDHVQQCKKLAVFKHAQATAKTVATLYDEIIKDIKLLTLEDFQSNIESAQRTAPILKVKLAEGRIKAFIDDLHALDTPKGADATTVCKHFINALEDTKLSGCVRHFNNITSDDRAKDLVKQGIQAHINSELNDQLNELTKEKLQGVVSGEPKDRASLEKQQEEAWENFLTQTQAAIEQDKRVKEAKAVKQLEEVKVLVTKYLQAAENDQQFNKTKKDDLYSAMAKLNELDSTKVPEVSTFIKDDNSIKTTSQKLGVNKDHQDFTQQDGFYGWGGDVETAHGKKKEEADKLAKKVTAVFEDFEIAKIKTWWEYIKTAAPIRDAQLEQTTGQHLKMPDGKHKDKTVEEVIQLLSNDIPHRIEELLAPFKQSATTGSSDFFEQLR
jgi:hypothetical protein